MSARGNFKTRSAGPRRAVLLGAALSIALAACGSGGSDQAAGSLAVVRESGSGGARLRLSLDRESITTADSALLRLEVESQESDSVEFPDTEEGFGEFAVTRDDELPTRLLADGRAVRGREYVLQPFLPGEYELPRLEVTLNGSARVSTEPVAVTVESVIADPEDADLRDTVEVVDMPAPWWWSAVGIALLAVLLGAAWWWRRRKRAAAAAPPVPPHEAALAALEALLAADLPAQGAYKQFYLRLSGIVRRYLEDRFGLRAPEQTTEEFLASMTAAPVIRREHQALLRGFLRQADMVKFAKVVPAAADVDSSVAAARRFVEQTVPEELPEDKAAGP